MIIAISTNYDNSFNSKRTLFVNALVTLEFTWHVNVYDYQFWGVIY